MTDTRHVMSKAFDFSFMPALDVTEVDDTGVDETGVAVWDPAGGVRFC
jgi:hypothetical protein